MNSNPPQSQKGYVDVFPFVRVGEELRFLLLRRSKDENYPGIWQGVSGGIADGETATETAVRELKEETGAVAKALYALDHVSSYYLHHSNEILMVPAFAAELHSTQIQISSEHDEFDWFSLDDARERASWKPYGEALSSIPRLLKNVAAVALARIDLK